MVNVGHVSVPITANLPPFAQGLAQARAMAQKFESQAVRNMAGVTRGIDGATAATARMTAGAKSATAAVGGLRGTLLGLGTILGPLSIGMSTLFAVRTMTEFGKSMGAVQAVTRATITDMAALTDQARMLGATTEFTAAQAAEGMRFLGMAGFQTNAILETTPAMLDLATAATMDLGRAADIVTNVMTGFGLAASQSGAAADVMAAIASRSNTNIEQLGQAMKFVGPVASAFGKDVGETAAALGALGDAGLQATLGGTGLRRVYGKLANPTKEAQKVIASLGLTLDQINPTTNSTVDIVRRLAEAGLTAGQALKIFGDRGGPAILALIANEPKLRMLTEAMADTEGEAKRMADTMRNTLWGSLKTAQAAIEDFFLAIGAAGAEGGLRNILGGITEAFRAMSRNIEIVAGVAGGLATLAMVKLAQAIGGAIVATRAFTIALLANPIGLISVAIATVVGLLVTYKDETVEIGNTTIRIGGILEATWTTVKESVKILIAEMTGLATVTYKLITLDFAGAMQAGKTAALDVAAASERINAAWQNIISLPLPNFAAGMAAAAELANRLTFAGAMPPRNNLPVGDPSEGGDAGDIEKYEKRAAAIKRQVEAMKIEAATYGMSAAAAEQFRIIKELENAANEAGITLTAKQIEQNKMLGESAGAAASTLEGLRVLDDIRTPAQAFNLEMEHLNGLLQQGALSWEQYQLAAMRAAESAGNAWHQNATSILGSIQTVAQAAGEQNKTMVRVNKAAGIANAIISTHVGVTKALELPFPANLVAAAAVAAQGFASVAAIRSQSATVPALAAPSIPGTSSAAAPSLPTANTAPQQNITINVQGQSLSREQFREIIEGINDLQRDGGPRFAVQYV